MRVFLIFCFYYLMYNKRMSRAVPSKLVSYSALPIGVSHKNFDISFNSLIPTNSTGGSQFKTTGINRILFTVPAYQNCFLDNSRSHLAFSFETDTEHVHLCTSLGTSALFSRLILRSGPNVIEDITNLDTLNKILSSMDDKNDSRLSEGVYNREFSGGALSTARTSKIGAKQFNQVELNYVFRHGLLNEKLGSYLPLHSMNSSDGRAFTIELYLNDPSKCLQWCNVDSTTEPTGLANATYILSNVRYQMCLLRADQTIIDRFNNLSGNGQITIPFSTFRSYQNSVSNTTNITQVAEACSDLRKIHTVIISGATSEISHSKVQPYPTETTFLGGWENSVMKVEEMQLQVGNKYIFTEPLKAISDDSQLMAQVKNTSYHKGNMLLETVDQTTDSLRPAYEDTLFHMTTSFCYESSALMTNGISLGSMPLIMRVKVDTASSGKIFLSQSECGYNLVIKDGIASIKDTKDPNDFGY
jgi:hypothetical protein